MKSIWFVGGLVLFSMVFSSFFNPNLAHSEKRTINFNAG